eukprot:6280717-Prorocentrum_lima.AAC.1
MKPPEEFFAAATELIRNQNYREDLRNHVYYYNNKMRRIGVAEGIKARSVQVARSGLKVEAVYPQ